MTPANSIKPTDLTNNPFSIDRYYRTSIKPFTCSVFEQGQMDKRKTNRFRFEKVLEATIIGIDGTWAQKCRVVDVSDAGAKLSLKDAFLPVASKEFFLVFSDFGNVYRRCQRRWVKGDQIGVSFLKMRAKTPASRRDLSGPDGPGALRKLFDPVA